jgi:hypothetical protein
MKVIEGVITAYAADWLRYSPQCYLVWSEHVPLEIEKALAAIPNAQGGSCFFIGTIDQHGGAGGSLPQWAWEWIFKYIHDPPEMSSPPARLGFSPSTPMPLNLPPKSIS